MRKYEGKCPECGKTHFSNREGETVTCDCWKHCPMCGAEMQPYMPDLASKVYGKDGKHELQVLMACDLHSPPFFSERKPVEVVCT